MGSPRSPRVDVVFRLWQCDKENHGWREGRRDRSLLKFRSAGRAFTFRQSQFRTKKEYCFPMGDASPSLRTLAGIKGLPGQLVVRRDFTTGMGATNEVIRFRFGVVLPHMSSAWVTGHWPTCGE